MDIPVVPKTLKVRRWLSRFWRTLFLGGNVHWPPYWLRSVAVANGFVLNASKPKKKSIHSNKNIAGENPLIKRTSNNWELFTHSGFNHTKRLWNLKKIYSNSPRFHTFSNNPSVLISAPSRTSILLGLLSVSAVSSPPAFWRRKKCKNDGENNRRKDAQREQNGDVCVVSSQSNIETN